MNKLFPRTYNYSAVEIGRDYDDLNFEIWVTDSDTSSFATLTREELEQLRTEIDTLLNDTKEN